MAVVLCGHRRAYTWPQANVRNYYMQFEESQTQSLIDSKIMEFAQHARPPSLVRMWEGAPRPVTLHSAALPQCAISDVLLCILLQPGMPPAMPLGVGMGGAPQGVLSSHQRGLLL